MSNIYGRQVILPLTNKSGGGVVAGDVIIIDSANNDAFTTTTSAGVTTPIGVAQETIANNATGRVLVEGYAALVNVNASVTRLHYGKTHTVAKQATDAGASRVSGTFCCFLSSGTTPDALVYPVDLAGAALTNPMSHVGAIIIGGTAGAPTELVVGSAGQVLKSDGTNPGYSTAGEFATQGAKVATSETTTSTAYADLATTGPSVTLTVGASLKVKVTVGCQFATNTSPTKFSRAGVVISGANTVAAADWLVSTIPVGFERMSATQLVTLSSTGSTTFKVQYNVEAGTGTFSSREIIVEPVI